MTLVEEKREHARREAAASSITMSTSDMIPTPEEATITDGFLLPEFHDDTNEPPPVYGESLETMQFSQPGFSAGAAVTGDGRIDINISTKSRRLAELLAPILDRQITDADDQLPPAYLPPDLTTGIDGKPPPPMNIVIQIVGSRGDVQPFVALGKVLKDVYGHRVRIATHATFQKFVEENDLEFFSIGGDPAELMAFMVKHPGLMPGIDALKSGEVTKRRKGIEEMLLGCWRSAIEPGNGLGPPPKPHKKDEPLDLAETLDLGDDVPFVADAIIANPPSFAHVHLAEKLGIPLHMMFTMPWTSTRSFPHPLANIKSTTVDDVLTNTLSYTLVEMMTWQGLGDIINRFREKVLDLPAVSPLWAPGLLSRLKTPYTYCWSPALIPKPKDWGRHIDISGFYFLNLASSYTPDPELDAFLKAGPPPVYIGFGSIVVDDPNAMTRMIFDAIHLAGVRALVSKGWGGLGADDVGIPDGVFMLGNVPHDWLFQHVSAVVHHGGAGTTAAGIKAGKPTFVVPFFGDQPFWGSMVARADAGPEPIPYASLTAEKLAESLKVCLQPDTIEKAKSLGEKIREEDGTAMGGKSFHAHLDVEKLRCTLAPSRVAVWRVKRTDVRLSALAAAVLVKNGLIKYSDLKLYRSKEHDTEDRPLEPVSAGASSLIADLSSIGMSIADIPSGLIKSRKAYVKESRESKAASEAQSTSGITKGNTDSMTELSELGSTQGSSAQVVSPETRDGAESSTTGRPDTEASRSSENSSRIKLDAAIGASQNIERIVTTGVKSPMNFCLGLARGFRNIPRLYNDDTIRPVDKVTDLATGMKVAGKELGFGFYDGITGLVTQPIRGAEKDGAAGLVKGIGKGVAGLIVKPGAGIWGLPAYMMQGVHAEVNKLFSRSVQNYIITSRIHQGQIELRKASPGEQSDISKRWDNVKFDLRHFYQFKRASKGKGVGEPSSNTEQSGPAEVGFSKPKTSWLRTRKMASDQKKKLAAERRAWKGGYVEANLPSSARANVTTTTNTTENAELEQAIQASVRETSRGNAEDDAAVEAAIRQSIRAMEDEGATVPGTQSAQTSGAAPVIFDDDEYKITDEEYQQLIERAVQQSLTGEQHGVASTGYLPDVKRLELGGTRNAAVAEDDLYSSMEAGAQAAEHDAELERAIAASKEDMAKAQSQQTEEDIVLEYIKKQSLAEEEYRKQAAASATSNDDDEDLREAMELSLRLSGNAPGSGPSGSK